MADLTNEERIAQQVQFGNTSPSILGIKFNDLNGDGIQEPNEPGLANIPILLEPAVASNGQASNGQLNPANGDISTLTDANGRFSFTNLAPSNYVVTETTIPPGFRSSTPNPLAVTVGTKNVNVSFGNAPVTAPLGSQIVGCKYLDINDNGFRDGSEPGIKNVRIYIDTNGNGKLDPGEPSTLTDKNGAWSFNVAPGSYKIREVPETSVNVNGNPIGGNNGQTLQTNFPQSTPPNNIPLLDVTVAAGQTFSSAQVGDTPLYNITVNKFRDINGDGVRDAVNGVLEPPIANVPFILDLNGNGRQDPGEPIAITDANGVATFNNLKAGNYPVLEIFPPVLPNGGAPGNLNAPVSTTPNPIVVSAPGPQAQFQATISRQQPLLVADSTYTLKPNDPKFIDTNGDGIQEPGEVSIPGTGIRPIFANTPLPFPATNPAPALTFTPVIANTGNTTNAGVGNTRPNINVFKYNDLNGDGRYEPNQGETPINGVTVFLDTNNNGVPDAGEQQVVTNTQGRAAFTNLVPGNYTVREVVPTGFSTSTSAVVPVTLGTQDANVTFANTPNSNITGTKFQDLNQNGYRDGNEAPIPNVTVFLDTNNNGVLDPGELSTITNQSGNFAFKNLTPGTYNLREVTPPGTFQTTPPLNIVLGPNQTFACALVGNSGIYNLSVPKFRDDNRNGVQDPGEPPLTNIPFTLDLNRNGKYDPATEPLVRTNSNGIALFPNLLPGSYSVLEVFDASVNNPFPIPTGPNPVRFDVPGPNTSPVVPTVKGNSLTTSTQQLTASSLDPLTGDTGVVATASTDHLTNGGSSTNGVVTASSADSLLAPNSAGAMSYVDMNSLSRSASSLMAVTTVDPTQDPSKKLLLGAPTQTQTALF
jgi:protocatechuate 3,4-dioxygenase beta subunit